ncbi:8693_t:CDS:2 [Funneliformis geosporum]|uniref:12472_t:CDS:1 n=1 Tax=Funneliformis geosporum TaxID=1117311 RepID=A0A9W4SAI5_9GLOM|nr:8693_t:CDS:2 [Funneliformis geosporum]CAI2162766.1 12472_t:CDS:2 [Funneliformis geosporum]
MSQNQSNETPETPKRGFSMSFQSSKTKIVGSKTFIKKRRLTDDQEETEQKSKVEYITVFEDIKSKGLNSKRKGSNRSNSSKQDTKNKKDSEDIAPEFLTNNSGLSFGLNVMKKPTKDPNEKRESILEKIKDFKYNQQEEQLEDKQDTDSISNEKVESEKSLKEQAFEALLKKLEKEETPEERVERKSSFKV